MSRVKLRGFRDTQAPASAKRNVPASGQVLGAAMTFNPPSLAGGDVALGEVLQPASAQHLS